jgi:hypothetical protein
MFAATARSSRRCTIWNGEFSDSSVVLITPAEATARARILASAADASILATDLVERLDNGNPYFLVTVAELTGGGGIVVAIDAITGEVISSARLEHVERHRLPGRREAIAHAAYPDDAEARRVWAPSRASRSPFYPLWELKAGTSCAYVDVSGKVWTESPGKSGG